MDRKSALKELHDSMAKEATYSPQVERASDLSEMYRDGLISREEFLLGLENALCQVDFEEVITEHNRITTALEEIDKKYPLY